MTHEKIKKLHRWYSWVLAALLIVVGVLFILSCLDIYAGGPRSYSAESVAAHFRHICIPVYLAVIGVVGGILLNLFLPNEQLRRTAVQDPGAQMLRLRKKSGCPPVTKEVRIRWVTKAVTGLIFAGALVYPLIYFLTPEHFTVSNLNRDIVKAILVVFVPSITGLLLCWGCRSIVNSSLHRETALYKQALASGQKNTAQDTVPACANNNANIRWVIRCALIVLALVLILLGLKNGGAEDVLKKAIAICTECIGLG